MFVKAIRHISMFTIMEIIMSLFTGENFFSLSLYISSNCIVCIYATLAVFNSWMIPISVLRINVIYPKP